jgi:hypothetical protein
MESPSSIDSYDDIVKQIEAKEEEIRHKITLIREILVSLNQDEGELTRLKAMMSKELEDQLSGYFHETKEEIPEQKCPCFFPSLMA